MTASPKPTPHPVKSPRKLIEVALPLDKINAACAREKSIRHGHPSTLHLWWARRPLAAARAVIFAQMVNDPGYQQGGGFRYGVNKEKAAIERERLFGIIERLVLWENTNNEAVLEEARAEIRRSWREVCELNRDHPHAAELFNPTKLPAFHDPFAGGGAIPLEAQRLGLESYASDLNPVAVTINKAMIEIPPKFAGRAPVGPVRVDDKQDDLHSDWSGAKGLAEDVRRYGAWMRAEAEKRIGHLYPPIEVTAEMAKERPDLKPYVGEKLTVIAWLWARTVRSPNPAFADAEPVPLASTFVLSGKEGKQAFVVPVADGNRYRFTVHVGEPSTTAQTGTKASGRGANFSCLLSGTVIPGDYIKAEGQAGRMGTRLMAVVAEGSRGRVYLAPSAEHEGVAFKAEPGWRPTGEVPARLTGGTCVPYGLKQWSDLFTKRQLLALQTFSDLVSDVIPQVQADAVGAGWDDDRRGISDGGLGARAYGEAVGLYLALATDKVADRNSALCAWASLREHARNTFGRQSLPMTWDFAESNPLSDSSGNFEGGVKSIDDALQGLGRAINGFAEQADAQTQKLSRQRVVSADPPYYDNIAYADLSDFFYVWLRRSLKPVFPELFATLEVPKAEELVATAYRHGGKDEAEAFFLYGMRRALQNLASEANGAFPITIYYAFKQAETRGDSGTHSTGWETFLGAVLNAGLALSGTWPLRTELDRRMVGAAANALASSILLVCAARPADAPTVSRRDFIRELNAALPVALDEMTRGGVNSPVAPVDLSQAIIGPGMAIFSRYAAVLEADGKPMSVRTALRLINRFLAEDDFDHDTQFCLHWFDTQGWAEGRYGEADVLARAKGTSVGGIAASGVLKSGASIVRLLRPAEYTSDWEPARDQRTPVWEAVHHLIRALRAEGSSAAGALLAQMPDKTEPIRALAYRLYTLCERKGWADDARAYNELITSWEGIEAGARDAGIVRVQAPLDI